MVESMQGIKNIPKSQMLAALRHEVEYEEVIFIVAWLILTLDKLRQQNDLVEQLILFSS